MDKTKLVVSMEDEEYQSRLVKCLMNHYRDIYELYVVDDLKGVSFHEEDYVVILSDGKKELSENPGTKMVLLQDDLNEDSFMKAENIVCTQKYQEVYKIVEQIDLMRENKAGGRVKKGSKKASLIGVFSLEKEVMQLPFCALLAETLGDMTDVLLIDMQPYSGLSMELEKVDTSFGLEDLLSVATTEVYTSNRLMASIGHEQKWDYVYPVKNISCLAEAENTLYQKVIDILIEERGYKQVIINFGAVFSGVSQMMERCDNFYFLKARGDACSWREKAFLEEMRCQGKENFLKKISWIHISMEYERERSWRQLAKTWLWSELGDQIREQNWMEK